MDLATLVGILTALVGALGIKEIWSIIKKKVDHQNKRETSNEKTKDELTAQVIEELKTKIIELETKIDSLIKENIALREKLARMEERLMQNAKSKAGRKRKTAETKTK